MLSHVQLFVMPWTVAHQAPLSMGFPMQEYWSGLPFPSPGDLPNPGTEPESPAMQADSLPTELQGKLTEEHGGVQKSQTQLSDETATIILYHRFLFSVFF